MNLLLWAQYMKRKQQSQYGRRCLGLPAQKMHWMLEQVPNVPISRGRFVSCWLPAPHNQLQESWRRLLSLLAQGGLCHGKGALPLIGKPN